MDACLLLALFLFATDCGSKTATASANDDKCYSLGNENGDDDWTFEWGLSNYASECFECQTEKTGEGALGCHSGSDHF